MGRESTEKVRFECVLVSGSVYWKEWGLLVDVKQDVCGFPSSVTIIHLRETQMIEI